MEVGHPGYEVIAEDSPNHDLWLASVRGIGLLDVIAKSANIPDLPLYMPTVPRGSGKLFTGYTPEFICVTLGDVVSTDKLLTPKDLHKKFGVPSQTKIILLAYGADRLIENLWPRRKAIFRQLTELGFSAVTSVNYSIWDNQPHAERFINIKRGLLTFEDWQEIDVPVIPHIYWYGRKDMDAWVEWFNKNRVVKVAAINLQTIKNSPRVWARAIEDLQYFTLQLQHPIHYIVTGPSIPVRIEELKKLMPKMTLTNGYAMRMAAKGFQLSISDGTTHHEHLKDYDRSDIAVINTSLYGDIMKPALQDFVKRPLITQTSDDLAVVS